MAASIDINSARKNLSEALGESMKMYVIEVIKISLSHCY